MHTTPEQYRADVETAARAASAYYDTDETLLSDGEYDALLAAIAATELAHPEWKTSHQLLTGVAGGRSAGGDVVHAAPMLSLDNIFDTARLAEWCADRAGAGFVVEVKLDGLSLAVTYVDGRLTRIATRGDGSSGEDVTHALSRIPNLPHTLTEPVSMEVRGEVLFTNDAYARANEGRVAAGKTAFVNARNAAAGVLRTERLEHDAELSFFAHGLVGTKPASWSETLELLRSYGLPVCTGDAEPRHAVDAQAVVDRIEAIAAARGSLDFVIDGAVVKLDRVADQERFGASSRAPRWAVAFKYPTEEVTSQLLAVEWTVGRTGRITPRAEIEPCFVGGTTITYATLHNADDIARKDLRIGDRVVVKRAGEVIPRIEGALVAARTGAEAPVAVPSACPRCAGAIDRDSAVWRCVQGRRCGLAEAISYATSRDVLDIEGMGPKVVNRLVESGAVSDLADIFTLTPAQLESLERMGSTAAAKILEQIEQARTRPLSRVLTALGIRTLGRSLGRRIAAHFGTLDAVLAADVDALSAVEGIGPERAAVIHEELHDMLDLVEALRAAGVNTVEPVSAAGGPLQGEIVVVTGTMTGALASYSRGQVQELVREAGGTVASSVSSKTTLLVAGDAAGSKLAKAAELGVKVVTPDDLFTRTKGTR
jgi:DNA ligase (NAD+)